MSTEDGETQEPRCGLQELRGAGSREGRALGVGACRAARRASDDDPAEGDSSSGGSSNIFGHGGKKKAKIDDQTVRSSHVGIQELAVPKIFSSRKLRLWTDE